MLNVFFICLVICPGLCQYMAHMLSLCVTYVVFMCHICCLYMSTSYAHTYPYFGHPTEYSSWTKLKKLIVPGLSHQHFRIIAPGFCKLQDIDELTLKVREAWNDKGTRKYNNIPKQRANRKKRQETKKICNQLIKSQLLTQRAQSSKPSGREQSAGEMAISEAQKQGILRSMEPKTKQ